MISIIIRRVGKAAAQHSSSVSSGCTKVRPRSLIKLPHKLNRVLWSRCIYAYFMGVPLSEVPMKEFQQHLVYELTPGTLSPQCNCEAGCEAIINFTIIVELV